MLRKRQKLSQRSLAAMAGITQPTVIALEVRNSGRLSSLNGGTSLMVKNCTLTQFWLRFSEENA